MAHWFFLIVLLICVLLSLQIDLKRAHNIEIMLTMVKMPLSDMMVSEKKNKISIFLFKELLYSGSWAHAKNLHILSAYYVCI